MGVSRWERLAPLTGAAFVVLYFVGLALIGQVGGTSTPSPGEIVDLLEDGPVQIMIGVYLSLVSVVLLVWFAGSLRSTLRVGEGGTGRLSTVAFGGGVAAGAAMLVSYGSIGQAALRADSADGISPEAAVVFYDLHQIVLGTAAIGFAVLIGATAVVSFRTRVFPSWLVWSSVVLAIGLVSPVFFIVLFGGLAWVLLVSIWLFIQGRGAGSTEAGPEPTS